MPLPVIHSFAGYSIYHLSRKNSSNQNWKLLCLSIFLANLADFDFLPGILVGEAGRFHRGISHSLGAAVFCGVLVALTGLVWKKVSFLKTFLISSGTFYSHALLDFFSDPGKGVPLFWPLSPVRYSSPVALLSLGPHEEFGDAVGFSNFFSKFFSRAAMSELFFELTLVFSLWAGASIWSDYRRKVRLHESAALSKGALAFLCWISFLWVKGMG